MITSLNYYELNNKGLSQSKIKDFEIDMSYGYKKHITGEIEKPKQQAFVIGGTVDDILTDIDNIEHNNYCVLEVPDDVPDDKKATYWMTKAGKEYKKSMIDTGKIVLSPSEYREIIELGQAVLDTSAYKEIKKDYVSQEIIQIPRTDLGPHFDCLYGKPDFYKIFPNGLCRIVDLKTTKTVENTRYFYNSLSYGYFKQFWYYSYLLKSKYENTITHFEYYNLAVEKKQPYLVKLFKVPNKYVEECEKGMLEMIDKISKAKEFNKIDASFESPTLLSSPQEEINGWDDEEDKSN